VAYRVRKVDLEEMDEEEEEGEILGLRNARRGFGRAIEKAVLALVAEKLEQYPAPGKVIVYSSSIDSADSLGEALGCEVYYRTVDTRGRKSQEINGLDGWERKGRVERRSSDCYNQCIRIGD
jgi:hypothetical protein